MQTNAIQRQYDEVIAACYDRDPQAVIGHSLRRALDQLLRQGLLADDDGPLHVLDLGMGTGRFLETLTRHADRPVRPTGLDLSGKMIDVARTRIPDLVAIVQDARHFDRHFADESFDLIATHFITGFVPLGVLAPMIWDKLAEGGYWTFVGGTKAGFPELQRKASAAPMRWLCGGRAPAVDDLVCNPADQAEVMHTLEEHNFVVRECESFMPEVQFANLDDFLEFAYYGGWLTPFIEAMGLHQAGRFTRLAVNTFFFPVRDHHSVEIVLAQKVDR
ncbi:hypothetical protein AYO44_03380 [Planctomycetaceae bacterium SCGC AG-212-F19]|nr:hypothetical protein AYO44_03380 [Planctomycetaceae bacterium SCGC AG-212-F19]